MVSTKVLVAIPLAIGAAAGAIFIGISYSLKPRRFKRKPATQLNPKRGVNGDICKQLFSTRAGVVPDDLDVIIIGSGMGGLCTAGLLSKRFGLRCLVLEQHDVAGGCLHEFEEEGFQFDTGYHYVGGLTKGSMTRNIFDYLTDGRLDFASQGEFYDIAHMGNEPPLKWPVGWEKTRKVLYERFPDEKGVIDAYFKETAKARTATMISFLLRTLPTPLAWAAAKWYGKYLTPFTESCSQLFKRIGASDKLANTLLYCAGDYGVMPDECPAWLQLVVNAHYISQGGFYPIGGPQNIVRQIIPTIEATGGRVLVQAPVDRILLEGNRAVGVVMAKGTVIRAPIVVSTAGMVTTYQELLRDTGVKAPIKFSPNPMSPGHFYLFIGIDGDQSELKLPSSNDWIHRGTNITENDAAYRKKHPRPHMTKGSVVCTSDEIPFDADRMSMFIGFPSAKDPSWAQRFPGKSTCIIMAEGEYEWVQHWKDCACKKRGSEYNALKENVQQAMIAKLEELHPVVKGKIAYTDLATPLTNKFYLNAHRGASYGLNHDLSRFSISNIIKLRATTSVKGLYVGGQDQTSAGIVGALMGGVIAAGAVANDLKLAQIFGKGVPPPPKGWVPQV